MNRGSDLRYNLGISLEEAYSGGKHQIQFRSHVSCSTCNGSGSKTGKVIKCKSCNGSGRERMQQGFFVVERTCGTCGGVGETIADPCPKCRGQGSIEEKRSLNVNIPAGVEEGTRMRITGEGEAGIDGSKVKLNIPEGTQSGMQFRVKGKGMPIMKSGRFGDMIVHVKVEIPVRLTQTQKDMLKKFDEACGENCNPESQSFFGKMRGFFEDLKKR